MFTKEKVMVRLWLRSPHITQTTFLLEAKSTLNIRDLRQFIAYKFDIFKEQDLYLGILKMNGYKQPIYKHKNAATISDLGFRDEDIIYTNVKQHIHVYTENNSSETILINEFDLNQKIIKLMQLIHKKWKVHPIYQRIKIPNTNKIIKFTNKKTLKELRIQQGMGLQLIMVPMENLFMMQSLIYSGDIEIIEKYKRKKTKITRIFEQFDLANKCIRNTHEIMKISLPFTTGYYKLVIHHVFKIIRKKKFNETIFNSITSSMRNKGNVKYLYHACAFENLSGIINEGFNRDYDKKLDSRKCTSFAPDPIRAAKYSKKFNSGSQARLMLQCKVIMGSSTIAKKDMTDDDLFNPETNTNYDSLVDDLDNPSIIMINKDYHAYPVYGIVFALQSVIPDL